MRKPSVIYLSVLLLVSFFSTNSVAYADLLVLKNGDRITGEIKALWDAEITIEPSYADEFNVDSKSMTQ